MSKPRVLGLVGPTASGKSVLALLAAQALEGEIVCMDAMQVYRGMDIGTAKPTAREQALAPHHLLDVADPDQPFSVADYLPLARAAIDGILARGCLPVLCGGTGLYLRALSRGLSLGGTRADPMIRARYQRLADSRGNEAVHAVLMERDPDTAARLHPNNLRRVIRALEVQELTGRPFSAQAMPSDADGPYDMRLFALDWPRERLYQRIDRRAGRMLEEGLAEEVRSLLKGGLSLDAQSMQGLGYKELVPYLEGRATREQTVELLSRRTRNYAKRQLTWFRADARIRWLAGGAQPRDLLDIIKKETEAE